jgi:hypothetical protein
VGEVIGAVMISIEGPANRDLRYVGAVARAEEQITAPPRCGVKWIPIYQMGHLDGDPVSDAAGHPHSEDRCLARCLDQGHRLGTG